MYVPCSETIFTRLPLTEFVICCISSYEIRLRNIKNNIQKFILSGKLPFTKRTFLFRLLYTFITELRRTNNLATSINEYFETLSFNYSLALFFWVFLFFTECVKKLSYIKIIFFPKTFRFILNHGDTYTLKRSMYV